MADKFDEIVFDLDRLRFARRNRRRPPIFGHRADTPEVFGAFSHEYRLNAPLTEEQVAEFESAYGGIRLPEGYRQFLIHVGNGGAGPAYGLCRLGELTDGYGPDEWDSYVGRLDLPFPHMAAWNDTSGLPKSEEFDETTLDTDYDRLREEFDERYWDKRYIHGAIPICEMGCNLRYWLVVNGAEVGNIWFDRRVDLMGLEPVRAEGGERLQFFEWYRHWLDDALLKTGTTAEAEIPRKHWWSFWK